MLTESQRKVLLGVQETSSRYFNLEDFIVNEMPVQVRNNDLYTLEEVAKVTSMSIVTIRQYVRNRKLDAIKQWKNWMVPSNELARLLYSRMHGVSLPVSEVMLVVVDAELYEEDSPINQYQLVTASDLLKNIQADGWEEIERYIKSVMPKDHGPTLYVEAISNIKDFFRRSGEVIYNDFEQIESPLHIFIPENKKISKLIKNNVHPFLEETPAEALKTIKEHFGDLENPQTILNVYKTLLDMTEIAVEIEHSGRGNRDD
ncbi:helix-turn-helix domain-containing protein [Planomicrobium sp. CPCC 101110]|uniref:helix-turn-helix domain-containing protein n=1 Tax=Planomicrobium sp. CPCC 101110 TaxID=2599619 RepID=UPI0011B39D29|nr:helix-turn-helix domain-containing protein [Planomicrobium sp. CPCC 101110]TWT25307.1 helix-turn-helix domain-containing protein [Planomicrobium sp. CPCC 101110]